MAWNKRVVTADVDKDAIREQAIAMRDRLQQIVDNASSLDLMTAPGRTQLLSAIEDLARFQLRVFKDYYKFRMGQS